MDEPRPDRPPPVASRLFQINEDDLAELERTMPRLLDAMYPLFGEHAPAANQLRVQWRRVQQILVDVRWRYGPPSNVTVIPAGDTPDQPA